jgi:DNA-binding IclR family transcriptional regulator
MRVVQTLQRGLAVLDFLREADEPVRTSDVADHFEVDKANASRLLATLHDSGWVRRTADRRYILSPKFGGDGRKSLENLIALRETTHPLLENLVEISGECAHMAVCVGEKVWYVDKVPSPQVLRVDHPVGALSPLHCTALGKVFLAFAMRPLPADLQGYTSRTLTDAAAVEADLEQARRRGFATDNEEYSPGVRCVAAPIRRGDGLVVAAVGLSGPSARVDATGLNDLGRLLRDRCRDIVTREEN